MYEMARHSAGAMVLVIVSLAVTRAASYLLVCMRSTAPAERTTRMSEMHTSPDRIVWFDLPVADLARASRFYGSVLGIKVHPEKAGRIRDAVRQAEKHGGRVLQAIESIGAHGLRAIVLDSEGNRIALHSSTDK
jgi:predicted enzyme related to lactoylglutathione lyase